MSEHRPHPLLIEGSELLLPHPLEEVLLISHFDLRLTEPDSDVWQRLVGTAGGSRVRAGYYPDAMERFRVEGADSLLGGQQATCLLPPLGNRWLHVQGVVERARFVAPIFDEGDQALLITAAYLYDLGYAPSLKQTGFQPLDGAVYLRSQGYERVACLVTRHFAARYEAQLRGCDALLQEFPRERSPLADALEYCNCTTGPTGEQITLKQCAAEIRSRYQAGDVVVQALGLVIPHLALAVARTQQRLLRSGAIHV